MKSGNFIESDYGAIKQRHKSLLKHYERLKEIKKAEPKPNFLKTGSVPKTKAYYDIGRKLEISRTNKVLLEKMMHITNRKATKIDKLSATTKNLKSLNLQYRKKEASRIVDENEKIAKRLRKQKALITKKKLDKDFEKFKQYRVQVSKSKFLKYQESFKNSSALSERKDRSMTPTLEKNNLDTERTRVSVPSIRKSAGVANNNELAIEDDSSYEDDFS